MNSIDACDKKKKKKNPFTIKTQLGASLVVQWLRFHLTTQGTPFDPWPKKIPHCRAAKPVHHSCQALEPTPATTEPMRPEPTLHKTPLTSTRESPCKATKTQQPPKQKHWDLPRSPVVRTWHAQCSRHKFDPWWGSQDPASHIARPRQKTKTQQSTNRRIAFLANGAGITGYLYAKITNLN